MTAVRGSFLLLGIALGPLLGTVVYRGGMSAEDPAAAAGEGIAAQSVREGEAARAHPSPDTADAWDDPDPWWIPYLRVAPEPTRGFPGVAPGALDAPPAATLHIAPSLTRDEAVRQPTPPVPQLPLTSGEVDRLLRHLPPLPPGTDPSPARFPPEEAASPDPPPGASPDEPSRITPAPRETARVIGMFPSGETEVAVDLTVVFTHPMIALGEAARHPPRVELTPEVPGRWRWLDPYTARFEPEEGRLPGGSDYRIRVPAGPQGTAGGVLAEAEEAGLRIRGPLALGAGLFTLQGRRFAGSGRGVTDLEPVVVLAFDQEMDPEEVARRSRFQRDPPLPAQTLDRWDHTPARWVPWSEVDPELRSEAEATRARSFVALAPRTPLPRDQHVAFVISSELTSREGPVPAGRGQRLTFRTRADFHVTMIPCAEPRRPCVTGTSTYMTFSNPVDPSQPLGERIRISPEVPGWTLRPLETGNVWIYGDFQPWSEYRLEIDGALVDVFGSPLGQRAEATLRFERANPILSVSGGPWISLDPTGPRELEVPSRGLERVEVRFYEADPERLQEWVNVTPAYRGNADHRLEGLRLLGERVLLPEDGGVGFSFLRIPIESELESAGGQLVVSLRGTWEGRPVLGTEHATSSGERRVVAWVQVPSVNLTVASDDEEFHVLARDWAGAPVEGVRVRLPGPELEAISDADGKATIRGGPDTGEPERASFLLAEHEGRTTLVGTRVGGGGRWSTWAVPRDLQRLAWAAFLDRSIYRAGETLAFHGWVRMLAGETDLDLELPGEIDRVAYVLELPGEPGSTRLPTREDTITVGSTGAFMEEISLPPDAQPGFGSVHLRALRRDGSSDPGWTTRMSLHIRDFRRPEYTVEVSTPPEVRVQGQAFPVRIRADYFDGPGLPHAEVEWTVRASSGSFQAPGWQGWRFGSVAYQDRPATATLAYPSRTDREGVDEVLVTSEAFAQPFPVSVQVNGTVQDLSRQAGSASTQVVVLPASVLPALRMASGPYFSGDSLTVEVVALTAEGTPVSLETGTAPRVRLERLQRDFDGLSPVGWSASDRSELDCEPVALEDVPAPAQGLRCRGALTLEGEWTVSAELRDGEGRLSRSHVTLRVESLPGRMPPVFRGRILESLVGSEPIAIIPEGVHEGDSLRLGDSLRVELHAPFSGAVGFAVLHHHGIRRFIPLRLEEDRQRLDLALSGGPGGRRLDVVLHAPDGPRVASGTYTFGYGLDERRLNVELEAPEERVEPGDVVPFQVKVRSREGAPVPAAEVTLWVVDEAVLSMAGRIPTAGGFDPWPRLYGEQARWTQVTTLQSQTYWAEPQAGPGELRGRIFDGSTGSPARGARVQVLAEDGSVLTSQPDGFGRVRIPELPHGPLRVVVLQTATDTILRRVVDDGQAGIDLGTLILPVRFEIAVEGIRAPFTVGPVSPTPLGLEGPRAALRMRELVVTGVADPMDPPPIAAPRVAPVAPLAPDPAEFHLREDFSPLAGMVAGLFTDADGNVTTEIRLPGTITRYRVFASVVHGVGDAGSGEALVVAGRDFHVRAAPPRFLRVGDQAEVSLLLQNGSDTARTVDVALRGIGVGVEGSGGTRVQVPPRDRIEVRFPTEARAPGWGRVEVVAESGADRDAVAASWPIEIAAAPEVMALRAPIREGAPLNVELAPGAEVLPGWGGLEVLLSPGPVGVHAAELDALADAPFPWLHLRVARVRGGSALMNATERSPAMARALDPVHFQRLREMAEDDLTTLTYALAPLQNVADLVSSLGQAMVRLRTIWVHDVIAALIAVREAHAAGLGEGRSYSINPARFSEAHMERQLLRALTEYVERHSASHRRYLVAHIAWALHRPSGSAERRSDPVIQSLAEWPTEDLHPVWLARFAAILGVEGEEALGTPFLRELENRAVITAGTVTFRTGRPLPGSSEDIGPEAFLPGSPGGDAEVLLALMDVAPDHPLVPGLIRAVSGPESGTQQFGVLHASAAITALEHAAQHTSREDVDAFVRLLLPGGREAEEARRIRTGDAPETLFAPMSTLLGGGEAENGNGLAVRVEASGSGEVLSRALFRWSASDPFLPPEARGFVVRRHYEGVDDPEDVVQDDDGIWRIRAGARVRIVTEMMLPSRRLDVRLDDPLPAGLEAIEGLGNDRASARDPDEGFMNANVHSWGPWDFTRMLAHQGRSWHRERRFRAGTMEAWAPALPAGTYRSSYLARATSPGSFIVPGPRAWEASNPDVMGRGRAERVVVGGPEGPE